MRSLEMNEISIVSGGLKKGPTTGSTSNVTAHDSSWDWFWHQIGGVLADDAIVGAGIVGTVSGGGPVAGAATLATAYKAYQNETPFQRIFNKILLNPFGTIAKAYMQKDKH